MRGWPGWAVAFVLGGAAGAGATWGAGRWVAARAQRVPDAAYVHARDHYVPGAVAYRGPVPEAVFKERARMAHVLYPFTHRNEQFQEPDPRHGRGRNYATWVFDEVDLPEHLLGGGLQLVIDSRMDPDATVGLHLHEDEEIYYVLEGSLEVTAVLPGGREVRHTLGPGDAHAVRRGEGHYAHAGPAGCRYLAIGFGKKA